MQLAFYGAARTVTGSNFLLRVGGLKILIDCGMFQGGEDEINRQPFPYHPADIDYLLLTHAHIDHSGRIPLLVRSGFRGTILAHGATVDLCGIMLLDSAHIQEMEAEWVNRKRTRAGEPPIPPLYTTADAQESLKHFRPVPYGVPIELGDGLHVTFRDAGHILGSSILEITYPDEGVTRKIIFTGDLGQKGTPILRDPEIIEEADFVVIESTYGNRLHEERGLKEVRLAAVMRETFKARGNLIIPAFAVGRTQEMLYHMNGLIEEGKVPSAPVFVDSPLAASATEVFRRHPECYDSEARRQIDNGDDPFWFPRLRLTRSSEESKALNFLKEPTVILSASGMAEAGRIKHHLKHNLWRPESTILFVGFQAQGTLGRRILDGAAKVKIFGEEISVMARIESIAGFSAHADQAGLLEWLEKFKKRPARVFVVHGEPESAEALALLLERRGLPTTVPGYGETYNLSGGALVQVSRAVRPVADQAWPGTAVGEPGAVASAPSAWPGTAAGVPVGLPGAAAGVPEAAGEAPLGAMPEISPEELQRQIKLLFKEFKEIERRLGKRLSGKRLSSQGQSGDLAYRVADLRVALGDLRRRLGA
jgi:metallo-beta-lactamase family protein